MGEAPLSLHLDATTREALERQARLQNVSEAEVAKQVIEQFLDMQAVKREAIAAAVEEAKKGVFISEEAMHRWIESWDTDDELPPPEPDIFLADRR